MGEIPYCEIAPSFSLKSLLKNQPIKCEYFDQLVTPKGLCQSFNSLTMSEIFKDSPLLTKWNTILNLKQTSSLFNPSGYGLSHGLQFVLNFYEPSYQQRSSKNFILSITNPNNSFDISKQNYLIKPGFSYTYKIIANQIVTTERFNEMDPSSRVCSLPEENLGLNLLKSYTKSGCEYECTLRAAFADANCTPWNILNHQSVKMCSTEYRLVVAIFVCSTKETVNARGRVKSLGYGNKLGKVPVF